MILNSLKQSKLQVALIQHFLVHYRQPIFSLMSCQCHPDPEYTFFSDTVGRNNIRTIDYGLNSLGQSNNSLRWLTLKNIWIGNFLLWQKGILKIACDKNFDCIIFQGSMFDFSTWIAVILARLKGKRVLMWTHGYLRREKNLKGWVRSIFYRLAHGLLLYGHRSRAFLLERHFDPNNLYIVYNSLNYKEQCDVQSTVSDKIIHDKKVQLFQFPSHPIIIFIGRLTQQKKISEIFEALAYLKQIDYLVNFLIVGDGPEESTLHQLASKLEISNLIVFWGPCYQEKELGPLIMLADICVAPGEVGLTCMHAFAYGKPVITHDRPDLQMPEFEAIEPGSTGDLFQYGDIEDLARVIRKWTSKSYSQEETALKCRAIIEKYYNRDYQLKIINRAILGINVD